MGGRNFLRTHAPPRGVRRRTTDHDPGGLVVAQGIATLAALAGYLRVSCRGASGRVGRSAGGFVQRRAWYCSRDARAALLRADLLDCLVHERLVAESAFVANPHRGHEGFAPAVS